MSYDPEALGADCAACILRKERTGGPVPPEIRPEALAIIVGEAPGESEVKKGAPFVGPAGMELETSLRAVGARRGYFSFTNALLCHPPNNELDRLLHALQKQNAAIAQGNVDRKLAGLDLLPLRPTPMECCFPRLRGELRANRNVITVGKIGTEAVTKRVVKIMDARGGPLEGVSLEDGVTLRVLPTLHPAFVMRSHRWRRAFRADLGRAVRWFTSGLAWRDPKILIQPSPEKLRRFLDVIAREPFTVFDVETFPGFPAADHYDPMFDRLKCIGIGTATGLACVVPFRSVQPGGASFYTTAEKPQIVALLREYLTSPRYRKVGWNSRYYDRMVVEAQLGVIPSPHLDALGLHRLAEPELPHNLGYAGSVHTDVDRWKQGHIATTAETDRELWEYNAKDTVVTAMTVEPLARAVAERGQRHLLPFFAKLQDVTAGLHRTGMYVNQEIRRAWDKRLRDQAKLWKGRIVELSGKRDLNPRSFPQIADLLFEREKIAVHHYTALGEPSTSDDALRAFLSETWGLDPRRRALVQAIRDYRKVIKRRGVVVRLRPLGEAYVEPEDVLFNDLTPEEQEERERRIAKGKPHAPGLVLPDGRVHADYLAHGTVGWRFSSSGPNMQNFENRLRDMFEAAPGRVLVACDEAQLELRMVVGLAKCAYYLERFEKGEDPHKMLCVDTFGDAFTKADPDQQKKLRRAIKELTYSSLYWAGNETKLEVITAAEDEEERLIFPDFTLREVAAFTDNWHRRNPEIETWWESILSEWRLQQFLAEPILGLKCDFLDGEDRTKLVNYKPQSGGAALCHLALFKVLEEVPFEKWGAGTGLVQQGHDSIVFEVPADHGPWKVEEKRGKREETWCAPDCTCRAATLARRLEEAMSEDGRKWGLPIRFTGEAKIGRSWKSV